MAIRRTVGSLLGVAKASDVGDLQDKVRDLPERQRVDALEDRLGRLERQVALVLDVVQGAARDAGAARKAAEEALSVARRAEQRATSALSTAESAADGIAALEEG